ncbi:MAG: caspase family protein [Bacteroidota bacterium]
MRKFVGGVLAMMMLCSFPSFSQCIHGNCFNGEGKFLYEDGSYYEGSFADGLTHGFGTWCLPNGDKYIGYFQDNFQHGNGIVYHTDGSITTGEWIHGQHFSAKGKTKEGCLEGDCDQGFGTYVYEAGSAKYTGFFKDEMPHGQGVCIYSNGEFYDGDWAKGSFHGKGTLFLSDGTPVKGYWKEGTYIGPEKPTTIKEEPKLVTQEVPRKIQKIDETIQTLEDIRRNSKVKVHALIIGISTYTHMPVLKYSDDDAYRMYAFLKSPEGGALQDNQIRMLIDEEATRKNIKEAMMDLFMNAGEDDLVMMYYSGHGLKDCFLPIDFDRVSNKLFHTEINEILNQSPAKYKLCIADACHAGGLAMKGGGGKGPIYSDDQIVNMYYRNLAKSNAGTALILSSKMEEISLESSGLRQGVFSHFLIRGLEGEADRNYDKIVNVSELFDFISTNVKSYTSNRQSPIIRGSFDKKMTVSVVR